MKKDLTPWLLLPSIALTLGGVSLLAPPRAASAAPPAVSRTAAKTLTLDDGDGDELLEHWGDPKYAREELVQLAGIGGGFILLGLLPLARHARRPAPGMVVEMPAQSDFLKLDGRSQSDSEPTRKAA